MKKQSSQWFIPILLAVGAGLALWYYWMQTSTPEPLPELAPEPVAEEPAEVPQPLHPVEVPEESDEPPPELVPLPPLNESDEYFKLEVLELFEADYQLDLFGLGASDGLGVLTVNDTGTFSGGTTDAGSEYGAALLESASCQKQNQ